MNMEKLSLRKAYGEALVEEGHKNKNVVALEADLGKSTMSFMFKEAFPDRYFEMGIAEQNMTSTAAGLALAGKIPFISTFAVFAAGRAYDQIRCSVAIPRANVKICGSSCGLSDFGDGKTHQSVEDGNIIKAIPNMIVLNPVDAVETKKMVAALASYKGPAYIRINRNDLPVYTPQSQSFEIGKMHTIREGADIAIFATGAMVWKSMEAAEKLANEGVSVEVINVSTLKPLKKEEILAHLNGKKGIVTAEEASRIGGLGSGIAELLFGEVCLPFKQIAIDDSFGTSAYNYEELLREYGLNEDAIATAVLEIIAK